MYARVMNTLSRHAATRVFRFFSRSFEAAGPELGAGALALRCLTPSDALAWCGDAELDLTREKVAAAFARGDLCIGAFDEGRLAAYCWLAFSPLPHLDGVWVAFHPQAVWTYKSFVRSAYRGRRLAAALYRFADALCVQRGRRVSVICVEAQNQPSIAAAQSGGYAHAGYAAYSNLGRAFLAWYSQRARQYGVRFYRPGR